MLRKVLSHFLLIHFFIFLGGFALLGFILTENSWLLLGVYFSFAGAICGGFIKVIDTINKKKENE